jgi:hypothetical protein
MLNEFKNNKNISVIAVINFVFGLFFFWKAVFIIIEMCRILLHNKIQISWTSTYYRPSSIRRI